MQTMTNGQERGLTAPLPPADSAVVYVIDDDASLRSALSALFDSIDLGVRAYPSVQAFLDDRRADMPGCLLLDVRLPGTGGLEFQTQLAGLGIELPIIMMTGHGDIPMSVRAMKAGALDFLAKPFREQELLDAVAQAIQQDRANRAGRKDVSRFRDLYETLSPREQQVMKLVTKGLMNKQVAGELGLSEITVKIHRGSMMRKMGVRTLPDLVRIAELIKPV